MVFDELRRKEDRTALCKVVGCNNEANMRLQISVWEMVDGKRGQSVSRQRALCEQHSVTIYQHLTGHLDIDMSNTASDDGS